jgi:hypothetical protein
MEEEAFFVPCNRMRDLLFARDDVRPEATAEILIGKSQLELRAGLSIEDILRYTYPIARVDMWSLACRTSFVWMGPDTVIGVHRLERRCLVMLGYEEVLEIQVPDRQPLWVLSRSSATRAAAVCDPLLRLLTEPHYSARYLTLTFKCGPPVSSLALSELLIRCENHNGIVFSRQCILTSE